MLNQELRELFDEAQTKMDLSYRALKQDISTLRSSRANPAMLDGVVVNAYNGKMHINQLANVSVTSNNALMVSVWDSVNVSEIKKAITGSNLGLNPIATDTNILVPIPDLTTEHRRNLFSTAKEYGERAKVNIRNIRRSSINKIRDLQKAGDISKDDCAVAEKKISSHSETLETQVVGEVERKRKEIDEL